MGSYETHSLVKYFVDQKFSSLIWVLTAQGF